MAEMPRMRYRLKILEPMILPNTTSWVPSSVIITPDMAFTTSSGAEVPMATTVKPITISETLNLLASDEAPSTRKSAPFMSNANPMAIKIILKKIIML